MVKQPKTKPNRGRGRPRIGSTQLTPRLHPDEMRHLRRCIREHGEKLHPHEAIRRLVQQATAQALNGAAL